MIESYSINIGVGANTAIPFNNTTIKKGCTVEKTGTSSFELNKCGVYCVAFDGSSTAASTVQLYKNGVAQPQAQSVGQSVGFYTLVQVPHDNNNCCCTSPTIVQVMNTGASTFSNANICITKLC